MRTRDGSSSATIRNDSDPSRPLVPDLRPGVPLRPSDPRDPSDPSDPFDPCRPSDPGESYTPDEHDPHLFPELILDPLP